MNTRLGFRTRGGPTQGWGNIFRLASFAHYCKEASAVDAVFFAEGPPEVETYLLEQGFEVHMLPEGLNAAEEELLLAQHERFEVIFVEMLDITPQRQAILRTMTNRLVVFDDLCDHAYDADLVVAGQDLPSHANRTISAPGTEFLVGYDYFLCRPEFIPFVSRDRQHSTSLEHVLVTLGGGSYAVGYLKAALALAQLDVRVTFILGYADHGDLANQLLDIVPHARIFGGVDDMPHHMWACDLVIGNAGYTKLEAAMTQTPCLMMSVQWHQIPLAQVFSERSGTPDLGYMSYVEPDDLARQLRAMEPQAAREEQAERAAEVVDGLGFERVYDAVFAKALR